MEGSFVAIAVIICAASILSIIFRFFKQPAVLAYILAGLLLGPFHLIPIHVPDVFSSFGQLGIMLLLFMLGLELRLDELRSVGWSAGIIGILQVWFTFVLGFIISLLLGFSTTAAVCLGIVSSFSSTIIVVKLLSDKKDLGSLYGKISVGILLIQDMFAIIALVVFSGSGRTLSSALNPQFFILLLIKLVLLFGVVLILGKTILPKVLHIIARSHESLFLFSLAWVFIISGIVASKYIGFSIEIGGFLAGLSLANATEHFQILSRMQSLRDFFITIFFVLLGMQMNISHLTNIILPVIYLTVVIVFGKSFITMILLSFFGHRKRTIFYTGVTLGQISEFSFILIFLANRLGYVPADAVSAIILSGIISFIISTYAINFNGKLYKRVQGYLPFLERTHHIDSSTGKEEELSNHIIIAGGHHLGQNILRALEDEKESVIIVDFNPDVISILHKEGIRHLFGDIADPEIQDRINLEKAKLVVSTVPDVEDNLALIEGVTKVNKKARIVVLSPDPEDAKLLYKKGADYVILPDLASSHHVAKLLGDNIDEIIERYKKKDMLFLAKI